MSTSTRRLLAIPKSFCIIDPHVHYWTPRHFSWLEGLRTSGDWKANSGREFLPSTYLEETRPLNIEQTVHIQANWTGEDCVGETEWEQQLAGKKRNMGHPHAICSYAPLHRPQEAEEILERHFAYPNFRGIRFMLDFDQNTPEMCQTDRDYINDPEFLSGMKLLNDYQGQIFELQVCQSQLTRAAELVSKFPDLNFILNHAGFPLSGEEKRVQWLEGINAVAQNENAYVKISALGMWEGGWSGVDKITGTIEDTLLAFGPNRSMFASNLPIDKVLKYTM